ncbi:unnamed protein product [Calicophoron daubneyi]|uniref:Tyrosine-protein kinase ephrin type A/B receptor-like domain-containing protein n=1 Tax=Calicophoron daubneyi TaxID=300641 RepID=A0AAV2TJW7_CALDB
MDLRYFLVLLLVRVSACFFSDSSSVHDLFHKSLSVNRTLVYYQHRVLVNRILQLPCYDKNFVEQLPKSESGFTQSFEWLLNGRQIRLHTPLIRASWDLDGRLTIFKVLRRPYTVWCHMRYEDWREQTDYYFGHQLDFLDAATVQVVFGVTVTFYIPDPGAIETKCSWELNTCDCRKKSGEHKKENVGQAMESHYVKDTIVTSLISNLEEDMHMCDYDEIDVNLGVFSVDDFYCVTDEVQSKSIYYTEFSFVLGDIKRYGTEDLRTIDDTASELEFALSATMDEAIKKIGVVAKSTFGGQLRNLSYDVYRKMYQSCLGSSGTHSHDNDLCELCPPGYFGPGSFANPKLPVIPSQFIELKGDQPHLSDQFASESGSDGWLAHGQTGTCTPCPMNTFSEEYGRIVCLTCPTLHMMPQENKANAAKPSGANWLHLACPKEGTDEVELVQVARGMLGDRFAEWTGRASSLTRVGFVVTLAGVPFVIALLLAFYAYALLDVGAFMVKMTQKMNPVEIQIAETAIAAARLEADQKKATEEVFARTKGRTQDFQ